MKKILSFALCLMLGISGALADELTVSDITIPEGGKATLSVSLTNTGTYRQLFEFVLTLPEGVTPVENSHKLSNRFESTTTLEISDQGEGKYKFLCVPNGTNTNPITGNSGVLMTVDLQADASLAQGTSSLTGSLTNIEVTTTDATAWNPANLSFNITIGAPLARVTLYETSTTAPASSNGEAVNVTVNRKINANEWSTICLPFDMTASQVTTAFGTDVQLRQLESWSFEGEPTAAESFTLNFTPITAITKNVPCLIKVTDAITSFDVDGVVVDPVADPDELYSGPVIYSVGTGRNKKNYEAYLYGTYIMTTTVDKDMFIADNQLWYSNGNTTIKAFRATFLFVGPDSNNVLLDSYNNTSATARVTLNFDGDATGVSNRLTESDSDAYYNLQGQRVDTPAAGGIFIRNGKKVIIK